jgi:uncharacterized protein (UPF0212 family)
MECPGDCGKQATNVCYFMLNNSYIVFLMVLIFRYALAAEESIIAAKIIKKSIGKLLFNLLEIICNFVRI